MSKPHIGILLVNVGTPSSPTLPAVRQYLKEFLSDRHVVRLSPWIWQPILHGYILRTRPHKSAALYQSIWTDKGSPLLIYSQSIANKLQQHLKETEIFVELGMRYGEPSIKQALEKLKANNIKKLIVIPLYPQYSSTTTASSLDVVKKLLKSWKTQPTLHFIEHYSDNTDYINAIAMSINEHRAQHPGSHLLFSYHGIPKHYTDQGDPYYTQCVRTTELITQQLQLDAKDWTLAFQSRLGRTPWLTPYTEQKLKSFPAKGIKNLAVICPGFAVDCLETLEEIAIRGRHTFLQAGGKSFSYIPALNDSTLQINFLIKLIHPLIK